MESSREIQDSPPLKKLRTEVAHTPIWSTGWRSEWRTTKKQYLKTSARNILSTLEDFKKADFECFQGLLSRNVMLEFEAIPKSRLENTSRHETVDEMVAFHTEDRAVKVAVETLKKLSLHDAAKTLMEKSDNNEDVCRPISTTDLLLCTLEELGEEDFKRFRQQLSHKLVVVFEAIPRSRLENATREATVDLMVGAYAEDGAVTVAAEILKLMRQNNAAKMMMMMMETREREREREREIYDILRYHFMELRHSEFARFQHQLSQSTRIGFEGIPRSLLENKGRQETVDLMVAHYTEEGAVTVMVEILKRIGQRNAAVKLQKEYRAFCQKDGTVSLTFIPTTW